MAGDYYGKFQARLGDYRVSTSKRVRWYLTSGIIAGAACGLSFLYARTVLSTNPDNTYLLVARHNYCRLESPRAYTLWASMIHPFGTSRPLRNLHSLIAATLWITFALGAIAVFNLGQAWCLKFASPPCAHRRYRARNLHALLYFSIKHLTTMAFLVLICAIVFLMTSILTGTCRAPMTPAASARVQTCRIWVKNCLTLDSRLGPHLECLKSYRAFPASCVEGQRCLYPDGTKHPDGTWRMVDVGNDRCLESFNLPYSRRMQELKRLFARSAQAEEIRKTSDTSRTDRVVPHQTFSDIDIEATLAEAMFNAVECRLDSDADLPMEPLPASKLFEPAVSIWQSAVEEQQCFIRRSRVRHVEPSELWGSDLDLMDLRLGDLGSTFDPKRMFAQGVNLEEAYWSLHQGMQLLLGGSG